MLIKNIVSSVKEYPPVRPKKKSTSGKKPIHSWEKLVCICILMVVFGSTYRNIQNMVPSLNLPWNEPYPDHTWISRTFKIPLIYLECILLSSAYLCLKEIPIPSRIVNIPLWLLIVIESAAFPLELFNQ